MYRIFLNNGFSGKHMGLSFAGGEARTEDAFLATRLRSKGYTVAADETATDTGGADEVPSNFDGMTVAQLKEYAETGGIDLGGAKTKAEIIAVISAFDTE